jgi:protein gp37
VNRTKIEWTQGPNGEQGYTWNPITGCRNGCVWCWARRQIVRQRLDFQPHFHPDRVKQPFDTKKPSKIFAVSMGDMFSEGVEKAWLDAIWTVMECANWHTFLVLTKRPDRMHEYVTARRERLNGQGYGDNIWLGVSVTNQADADARIPLLLKIPAAKRFVSIEPLLGPVDLTDYVGCMNCDGSGQIDSGGMQPWGEWINLPCPDHTPALDWVIIGAMTGPRAISPRREWVDSLTAQCVNAGVHVFHKQNLMGVCEFPMIQEWPK